MRPDTLVLLLTLPAALAAGSNELPQATLAPETVVITIEAPPPGPFDFRQGRNWSRYLQGTKPVLPQPKPRVLLQQESKQLRADAGACFTMRLLPVRPDIDPAIVRKAPDSDPGMILKAPPACERSEPVAPAPDRQFLRLKP